MGKIYTFINLVLPIIGSLVALQILLLIFRSEMRFKVNFFVFSVLAIATIRPNILGESFGLISPLYFASLVYFSRSLPPEYAPSDRAISRARNGLMMMLIILTLNWLFKATISSANGYTYSYWPPIASVLTVGISCFCILQIFKNGGILRFVRVLLYLLVFQAVAGLISKFILNYQYCVDFNAGRGWNYSLCAPGAIFSGNRLTGFSGEPSIFAVYLAVASILFWWPQNKMGVYRRGFLSGICIWASIVSGATTGAIVGLLALSLIPLQHITFKKGPVILIFYSLFTYTLIQTRFVQGYVEMIFSEKSKQNFGSITDRNLNLGIDEYLTRWDAKPFGSQSGVGGGTYSAGINLLAESLRYGPVTILLMILLVGVASKLSLNKIQFLSVGTIIFIVCLTLQPAWPNSIWFLFLYLALLVSLLAHSSAKK
jgi:hypothetical protein